MKRILSTVIGIITVLGLALGTASLASASSRRHHGLAKRCRPARNCGVGAPSAAWA